jgi:peptide/nickel transport system substrate-binding protein
MHRLSRKAVDLALAVRPGLGKAFSFFITYMNKLRWQILVVVVTLLVVAALLLTQEPGTTVFIPQPATGGVYTEGLVGSLSRLNPLLDLNNSADRDIDRLLFSGLIRFDGRGLPQPDLSDSWGTTPDGTVYNFSIRKEAVWHDGTPVTSDDVIFTLDLIKANASFFSPDVIEMWKSIDVKKINDKNIKFTLPEPFAPFLDYLAFGVLPRHLLGSLPPDQLVNADFNIHPVGTGPYEFDHLIVENGQVAGVVLTPFAGFYGQKPFIEQVVFRYYPTSAAALDAYRQGEILAISQLSPDVLQAALTEPTLSVHTGRLPEMGIIMLNLNNPEVPFLQDDKVRHALMLGLNRQWIVDKLLFGQAIIADGPIFPGTWAYYDGLEHVEYDPEAAIFALKADGYVIPAAGGEVRSKDDKSLAFTLVHPDDPLHTAIAQVAQQNWAKIGAQVTLEALPYDQLINERLTPRKYQAALVDLTLSRTPDPDPYPFWHQSEATGGQNYSQWDNRTASEYLEQARTNTDFTARARLYRNFQVLFVKDMPSLPLYYPVYSYAVDARVLGVQIPPLFDTSDRFQTITSWYLVTKRDLAQSGVTATP